MCSTEPNMVYFVDLGEYGKFLFTTIDTIEHNRSGYKAGMNIIKMTQSFKITSTNANTKT
ncbi:hypothetical protein TBC1_112261 [Lentimicrobium saccharophilum]|uniref:Uncharacterized protein n=1 Tax=Lentimicrobium saccharophilum TaxID=1678841 RepID=A0A0S7C2S7_9BACT|nr:hypothetical protein TBC1_112261 [Lentimicrobium saccharophilum]